MPPGLTPEMMCDWSYMVGSLERSIPVFAPGTTNAAFVVTVAPNPAASTAASVSPPAGPAKLAQTASATP